MKAPAMPAAAETPYRCQKCQDRTYVIERDRDRAIAKPCTCSAVCPHCQGSGYLRVQQKETFSARVGERAYDVLSPCTCRIRERRLAGFSNVGVPGVLVRCTLQNFRAFNQAQDRAKKLSNAFAVGYQRQQPSRGFVLSGPVGTGKTHLLAATLVHLSLELGVPCRYVEISLLYATIRRGFQQGKSGGEIIGPLSEIEVVAIDELGKGRGSQFEMETLDELIARRYNAGKTTLFATNYSLEPERKSVPRSSGHRMTEDTLAAGREQELLRDRVGERIYSRLCEMCDFVELPADTPDQRRMSQELQGRTLEQFPRRTGR